MPIWILVYKDKYADYDDITFANKRMQALQPDKVIFLVYDNCVEVDFRTGDIVVNGQKQELNAKPVKPRWINFQRVTHILNASGVVLKTAIEYFIGWQDTINGKNIKRMAHIYSNGKWEITDRS